MKLRAVTLMAVLATFGLLAGVAFAGGGSCGGAMAETMPEILMMTPSDVVDSFVAALNAGDMRAAQALFAAQGYAAEGLEGARLMDAELAAWLEAEMLGKGQLQIQTQQVEGNLVTLVVFQDVEGLQQEFTYQFAVANGRINSLVML
jgi:limonene-1,2-epoxide hydrolase